MLNKTGILMQTVMGIMYQAPFYPAQVLVRDTILPQPLQETVTTMIIPNGKVDYFMLMLMVMAIQLAHPYRFVTVLQFQKDIRQHHSELIATMRMHLFTQHKPGISIP